MKQEPMKQKSVNEISRRDFIKGSAFATIGTASFASAIGITGCAPTTSSSKQSDRDNGSSKSNIGFEIYDADIVVVGAGVSGSQSAIQAYAQSASIIVVDKGPFQFSGVGGMNFDIMMQSETKPDDGQPKTAFMCQPDLGSPKLYANSVGYHEWDSPIEYVKQGVSTLRRNADGTVFNRYPAESGAVFTDFGFTRHVTDVIRDKGIVVYDQTMITDFIVQDGVCRGVMGIHIPTGIFRVFRAKAVIKSTGGCTQIYGWKTVGACSTQGGDNTADTDIAALRHGCQLIGCEFFRWDTVSSKPDGIAFGYNAAFTCDTNNKADIVDIDGNAFLKDVKDRTEFFQVAAQAMANGKTNENRAFLANMTPDIIAKLRPAYKRNVELWKKVFDIDVEGSQIEVELQCYEHGGSPRIDENMMTLGIAGLFDVRGGEALGSNGGMSGGSTHRQARFAAVSACKYAKNLQENNESLDWDTIQAEINRLQEIRLREVEGGFRPHEVRRNIQTACYEGIAPAGNAEKYNVCIEELKRIIAEDIPKQIVPNKTFIFNKDWIQAIENYNIAYMGLSTVMSMLAREETRAQFLRTDFPKTDNEYWGKYNVGISFDGKDLASNAIPIER